MSDILDPTSPIPSDPASGNDAAATPSASGLLDAEAPALGRLHDAAPHVRVLSNGRYWTAVSGAGTGLSNCHWFAVTRWAGDRIVDQDGVLVYLRDLDSGETWSIGASPMGEAGGSFFVRSAPGSVTLGRRYDGIEATCEVSVAPEVDAEVRRLSLRNRSSSSRRLEVTVYAEIVVGHRGADYGHPAFAKLFVETAFDVATQTLTARRRPRSAEEGALWAAATLTGDGDLQVETDRCLFLGRARSLREPAALAAGAQALSGNTGSVLDPVFATRRTLALEPGAEASLTWVLAAGDSREAVTGAVASLQADAGREAAHKSAAAAEKARRRRHGLSGDQAELVHELAGAMLYAHPALAADLADREGASSAASPLGALDLPGDALLIVAPLGHGDLARAKDLRRIGEYMADLGLNVAVALLCEESGCTSAACTFAAVAKGSTCRIVVATTGELGDASAATLRARAHWLVRESLPAFADLDETSGKARASKPRVIKFDEAPPLREKLLFDNGYGGFSADGKEYVVRVGPAAATGTSVPPAPWSNIVANERFGFIVTESGAGTTWAGNSRQNKLTPWSNDPVLDPHGEALYLHDHANGRFWSPLPGPAPSGAWTEVRHGLGSTRWMQRSEALEQEVTTLLAGDESLRLVRIRLANRGTRERKLSLYSYARLVLGVQPTDDSRFVTCSRDEASGVLLARNPMNEDHAGEVAFAAVLASGEGAAAPTWTTDRAGFLGRGGSMQAPGVVARGGGLDGRSGEGIDPCFAFEIPITLAARAEVEVVLGLGQAASREEALALVERFRAADALEATAAESKKPWLELSSAIEVRTPSKGLDLLLNGWLLYQVLGCRMRARSAYYQSGGAYGFRDQLQDSSALVYARPDLARAQIVLHAAHQFPEGDVLHWWHPPAARGTRTRFSDDLLWLPYLASTYIGATGDESVLEEKAPFVGARQLAEGEDETYLTAERLAQTASVYEHCCLSIDRSLATGEHGLPLMGTGDWNDGMNRVGRLGRGESVWVGFFLTTILDLFIPIVEKRSDWEHLRRYRAAREALGKALEAEAWDGAWYRRAWYDDGTVLGSATAEECRIDAVAQSWSVLSGIASPERAKSAMKSVEEHLVDEKAGLIHLLWPPFDRGSHDPGYIKGYVPGIRENGGQYTHAAVWVVRALAQMGQRDKAMKFFEMISPIAHSGDRESADVYKVEPYVVAADIYGVDPHLGRGGWTWYTGSAAWMYRTAVESLLGLTIEQGRLLRVRPQIPDSWPGFRLKYRLPDHKTVYDIEVENPSGRAASVVSAMLGNQALPVDRLGARIVLRRDGKLHKVKVTLG